MADLLTWKVPTEHGLHGGAVAFAEYGAMRFRISDAETRYYIECYGCDDSFVRDWEFKTYSPGKQHHGSERAKGICEEQARMYRRWIENQERDTRVASLPSGLEATDADHD